MIAVIFICSGLLVMPVGGQPIGGYIAVPIQHGTHWVWNHIRHHQKKLKHRGPVVVPEQLEADRETKEKVK